MGFRAFAFGKFYRGPGLLSGWRFSAFTERFDGVLREKGFGVHALSLVGSIFNILSNGRKVYDSHEMIAVFNFPPVSEWGDRKLSECSAKPGFIDADHEIFSQRCFCIKVGEVDVWLPKIELAGRIFFHCEMLSMAAFEPGWLDFNFYGFESDDVLDIYCLSGDTVDCRVIEDKACRDHLGWLLTNREFRKSFESIWRCLNLEKTITPDGYSEWDFNFVPPECLEGVGFSAMGALSADGKEFLVWEVVKIEIPVSGGKRIVFHHKDLNGEGNGYFNSLILSPIFNPPVDSIYFEGGILTSIASGCDA